MGSSFFFGSVYSFLSSVFFFLSNIKIFIREKCEKKRVSLTLQRMNSHPWKHTNTEMQTFGTMQDIFSSSLFNWSHPHHSSRQIKKWLFFWNIFPYFQVFRHLSISFWHNHENSNIARKRMFSSVLLPLLSFNKYRFSKSFTCYNNGNIWQITLHSNIQKFNFPQPLIRSYRNISFLLLRKSCS